MSRIVRTSIRSSASVWLVSCLLISGCARANRAPLQDPSGHEDLSRFTIQSVTGVRDGDRLNAQVIISDSSSILTLDFHFFIGPQTTQRLSSWRWSRPDGLKSGMIAARSITFLGGQDDGPSIGGTFTLLEGSNETYRVNLPLTVLPRSFRPSTSNPQHP